MGESITEYSFEDLEINDELKRSKVITHASLIILIVYLHSYSSFLPLSFVVYAVGRFSHSSNSSSNNNHHLHRHHTVLQHMGGAAGHQYKPP